MTTNAAPARARAARSWLVCAALVALAGEALARARQVDALLNFG